MPGVKVQTKTNYKNSKSLNLLSTISCWDSDIDVHQLKKRSFILAVRYPRCRMKKGGYWTFSDADVVHTVILVMRFARGWANLRELVITFSIRTLNTKG